MYRAFVRRRTRNMFDAPSRGEYEPVLSNMADDVHHVFAGQSPLGGERHTRDAVRAWFERLFRLYDELRFDVGRIVVSGPPWNLVVGAEWLGHVRPKAGDPYKNEGFHVINIRRGRVVYFHAYEDSQKVAEACRQMAATGITEAAAAPIAS
jgi:ketosteroid isomerase-like protein